MNSDITDSKMEDESSTVEIDNAIASIPKPITSIQQQESLMWVEKYRPNSLKDMIAHENITNTISRLLSEGRVFYIIFIFTY